MITVFTQNCSLVNISNFSTITCMTQQNEDEEVEYLIVLDQNIILGKYDMEQIPEVIAWIGSSIANHKNGENLCLSMPLLKKDGDDNAENG